MAAAVPSVSAVDRARTVLENVRRTPMLRGGRLVEQRRMLKAHIESAMIEHSVPDRLAARVAFQLVLKCRTNQLGDAAVWDAIGGQVHDELDRLRQRLALLARRELGELALMLAQPLRQLLHERRALRERAAAPR